MRGIALIAVAVVLGVVLLQATDAPSPFEATTRETTTTTTTVDDADDDDTTTTAASGLAEPRDPGTYSVLVANGSGVPGVAARFTTQVEEGGFQTSEPSNAARTPTSTVYYNEGFEAEAKAVAALFTPVPEVAPLDLDPLPVDELRGASVVMVIGPDLATAE
ncbi:MAG TPA: LytR C-terminal domain-containing protein [Acidimicrobiales bacterium]|nr:LytR C-terminal domain-containing protein [Acidimicrobiales bacterium]